MMPQGHIRNLVKHARLFYQLVGPRISLWLLAGGLAGLLITGIELLISLQLANLLFLLGVSNNSVSLPLGLSKYSQSINFFITFFLFLGVLRGFLYFMMSHSSNYANEGIGARLRLLAFYESFASNKKLVSLSVTMARLADQFPKAGLFCLNLSSFFPYLLQVICLCLVLFNQSHKLTLIALVSITAVGILVHFVNVYVRHILESLPLVYHGIIQRVIRMGKNFYLLKALRMMSTEHEVLETASLKFTNQWMRSNALGNFAAVLPQILGLLTILALVAVELRLQLLPNILFISFLYLFLRMVQALSSLAASYGNMSSYFAGYLVVEKYLEQFTETELSKAFQPSELLSPLGLRRKIYQHEITMSLEKAKEQENQKHKSDAAPTISFRNVSFRYSDHAPWVLKNFALEIKAGDSCALMGPSGSGKSTILALLLGLLEPQEGKIEIDGQTPKVFFGGPMINLGFVGAEPFLIEGSVRENLHYGSRRVANDEEIKAALRKSHLGKLLESDNNFLEHRLTENGEGLSTGQKQRLMFARALLADPKLLLLDEASANLDENTEREMSYEIKKLQGTCTILIITHRSNFVSWVANHVHLSGHHDLNNTSQTLTHINL